MEKAPGKKFCMVIIIYCLVSGIMLEGCSVNSKDSEFLSPQNGQTPIKEVTLKFFFPGEEKSAKDEVLNALYNQTRERLHARFEFTFIPYGDYINRLTMMTASGNNYDAVFTADWLNYSAMATKKAFLNLNEILPEYAPNLYKYYKDHKMLADCSIDGQIMALPWTQIKTSKPVFVWRKDIADKFGIIPGELTTIEGIDRFLTKIEEANPGITVFDMHMSGTGTSGDILPLLHPKYEYADIGFHSFFVDLRDQTPRLIPLEQTEMFREAVYLARRWYKKGIISKNALVEKQIYLYENGRVFSKKDTNQALYETINFTDKSAVSSAVEIYPGKKFIRDSQMNNAMALNKYSANPERTLIFFELLTTDQSVYDTLIYGIKGKTYTINKKDEIEFVKGESSSRSYWLNWFNHGFKRIDMERPTVGRSMAAIKKEREYAMRPNIVISPLSGFSLNTDLIRTQLARRDQLCEEQGKLLLAGIGTGDVDKAIDEYIQNQKSSGLDKILVELQKQIDTFTKGK